MKNKLFLLLGGWMVVYGLVTALLFDGNKNPLVVFSVVVAVLIIGAGSYIGTMKPRTDAHGSTQQYIIATTVQILGALGYLLFARFAAKTEFKAIAIHFMVAFMVSLVLQSVFLIRNLRSN